MDEIISTDIFRAPKKYIKLEELGNVDAITNGLRDHHAVFYNTQTRKWETKDIDEMIIEQVDVDGGSF